MVIVSFFKNSQNNLEKAWIQGDKKEAVGKHISSEEHIFLILFIKRLQLFRGAIQ